MKDRCYGLNFLRRKPMVYYFLNSLFKYLCKKKSFLPLIIIFLCFSTILEATPLKIFLSSPAPENRWTQDAQPIGNGREGAMLFGRTDKEIFMFNEDSLWIGDEIKTGDYQTFGKVFITLNHDNPTNYRRELDISNSIYSVSYDFNGVHYTRESFASHPAGVMVYKFSADQTGAYTADIELEDAHPDNSTKTLTSDSIKISGDLSGYKSDDYQPLIILDYEAILRISHTGGTITESNGLLHLDKVDSFTIYFDCGTNYSNDRSTGWKTVHPHDKIVERLDNAMNKSYSDLKGEHIDDYQSLFNRLDLDLGETPQSTLDKTIAERLSLYRNDQADPDLQELLFQYARYLMISSSRSGDLPANLQGLWNDSNDPPWRSDYHSDVNIEMNYWFVNVANLEECFEPLYDWFNSIREVNTEKTHKEFPNSRGWVMHCENGIFGGSSWRLSKGDNAWIAQNMWNHYAFTLDEDYLKKIYPILKEICEFWVDTLKTLPDGTMVSPHAYSPEHGSLNDGSSYEQELIWNLFSNYIKAENILHLDDTFRETIEDLKSKLLIPKIGSWGQLQEWMADVDDPNDTHRHVSHLVGVYPCNQFSPITTPTYADAAKVSLNARGDGGTGWSKANKIILWARLLENDHAYKLLDEFIKNNIYNNLFGFHPPFQIDCNFGYNAGVCEMLIQSHLDMIQLLPALPTVWPKGHVNGIKARKAFSVNIAWDKNELTKAEITSLKGQDCTIYADKKYVVFHNGQAVSLTEDTTNKTITFSTEVGETYIVYLEIGKYFKINGKITGDTIAGVTLSLSGPINADVTSDASGNYSFDGLFDGDYTVTPTLAGYTFTPATASATVAGADVTGIDFVSAAVVAPKFTLTVNDGTGSGQYAENDTASISATVPAGQVFDVWTGDTQYIADTSAASTTVTMPAQDITVTATFKAGQPSTYSISGTVSGDVQQGVVVAVDATNSATTDASGNYTISGLADGDIQ